MTFLQELESEIMRKVALILTEPGITWKTRRALLRSEPGLVIDEKTIQLLVPAPEGEFHPEDY